MDKLNFADLLIIKLSLTEQIKLISKYGNQVVRNGQVLKRSEWDATDYSDFQKQQMEDILTLSRALTKVDALLKSDRSNE